MFDRRIPKTRNGQIPTRQVNQLINNVSSNRNLRPGPGLGTISTPFGQATTLLQSNLMFAYTAGGIPAGHQFGDGSIDFGVGGVQQATPLWEDDAGTFNLALPDEGLPSFPAYNMGIGSNGAVSANKFLVLAKIADVWFVIFELCD